MALTVVNKWGSQILAGDEVVVTPDYLKENPDTPFVMGDTGEVIAVWKDNTLSVFWYESGKTVVVDGTFLDLI